MITAVDTSVLLDIFFPDPTFGPLSKAKLRAVSGEGALIVCEVVYAEVAGLFPRPSDLESFLDASGIQLKPSSSETLWKAGELWKKFCLARPHHPERTRRLLADFLIGAHALMQAERLLTRDKDFFHATFTGLRLA